MKYTLIRADLMMISKQDSLKIVNGAASFTLDINKIYQNRLFHIRLLNKKRRERIYLYPGTSDLSVHPVLL